MATAEETYKCLVNENRLGSKLYFQYLEIMQTTAGKSELIRVSGKVGGSKREIRKKHASMISAKKEYNELLKHFLACGYKETSKEKLLLN